MKMEIQIEFIVIVAFLLVLFLWATWFRLSGWRLRKKYTPEKDLGRNYDGKEVREREGGIERAGTVADTEPIVTGLISTGRHEVLQTTTTGDSGKNSKSNGKTSKSSGKFLRKFRRR